MSENNHTRKKSQNVTIIDVANECGVSYSTVSRVLNGFEHVKESTRQRVLVAADKLGYVANLQARSLAGGRTNIIGLVIPGLDNGYNGEVARGIDEELAKVKYDLMLYTTHRHLNKESDYVKSVYSGLTDGLLLLVPLTPAIYLETLQQLQFPYVLIDQYDDTGNSNVVDSTNWQGAYDATIYLINLGHRKIAHITGHILLNSAADRLDGYKTALADHHIPIREDYIIEGDFWQRKAYEITSRLLQLEDPPTAIFAANDLTAFGAMEAIRHAGLSIPEDISIIGFDDVPQSLITYPKLTTVRQSLDKMGRVAVQLLIEQIENRDRPPRRITLATELIERESCRPLN